MIIHIDGDCNLSSFHTLADFKKEIELGNYRFDENWDTLLQIDGLREIDIGGEVKSNITKIGGYFSDFYTE